MMDLISRQAAIEAVESVLNTAMHIDEQVILENGVNYICTMISRLPSAQPEQQWIPCSERMPETDEDGYSDKLLVCFSNFPGCEICDYRIIDGIGKWYLGASDDCPDDVGVKVIAWMPLPEPYGD